MADDDDDVTIIENFDPKQNKEGDKKPDGDDTHKEKDSEETED